MTVHCHQTTWTSWLRTTHELSGVRGLGGTTGGKTNLAPGSRAWPVLAGSGGGSEDDERCVRLSPGSEGFLMCPLLRTGGGGGGAFFFTDALAALAVCDAGTDCDWPELFGKAVTTHNSKHLHHESITSHVWTELIYKTSWEDCWWVVC